MPDHTITSSTAAHKKKKEKKEETKKDKILNGSTVDCVLVEDLLISYNRDLGKQMLKLYELDTI